MFNGPDRLVLRALTVLAAALLVACPALAAPIQYQKPDGYNNQNVSADTPLPVTVISGGGGGGSGTEFAEDAAHSSGALGSLVFCVRRDTAASSSGTDGDYSTLSCDASGRLWTNVGALPALAAGTNNIGDVDVLTLPALPAGTNNIGDVDVLSSALPTGASTAANQATAQTSFTTMIGHLAAIETAAEDVSTPVPVNLASATTGGCTPYGYQSAASTNATNVKASAGTLCSVTVINTTATLYYLRLYNLASAPTPSSATGFVMTVPVPASATGAGVSVDIGPFGWAFGTGIGFALTGGGSSTDNTNAATGVYVMASYK